MRVLAVTGVQTCALPISSASVALSVPVWLANVSAAAVSVNEIAVGVDTKIGRASCRESVDNVLVAVRLPSDAVTVKLSLGVAPAASALIALALATTT